MNRKKRVNSMEEKEKELLQEPEMKETEQVTEVVEPETEATETETEATEPETEEVATVEEQKEIETPTGRAALRSRYKTRFPERNWDEEDDDALADQAISDYDSMEGKLKDYEEADAKMSKLLEDNPQSAAFLMGMANGEDFLTNLQKNFGEDIVEAMQNPDKLKELAAANKEYHEKIAASKKAEEEWEANMNTSLDNLRQAAQESGLTDDEVVEAMDKLIGVVDDYNTGKLDIETIKMFLNAINHDTDVEEAARKAEVRGRNANIEEQQRKRKANTDGIPQMKGQISGGGAGKTITNRKPSTGNGIWDEANMKRNMY